ncbi:MAG: hypothetical protein AAF921_00535 [Cyanobacteria bacterium P01_D01_bin.44]
MKCLLIAMVLAIATVSVARPAQADTQVATAWNPFELAFLAYRNGLSDQGIPGYGNLGQAYHLGQITAEDVVGAAVEADYLNATALEDSRYISSVGSQLEFFVNTY